MFASPGSGSEVNRSSAAPMYVLGIFSWILHGIPLLRWKKAGELGQALRHHAHMAVLDAFVDSWLQGLGLLVSQPKFLSRPHITVQTNDSIATHPHDLASADQGPDLGQQDEPGTEGKSPQRDDPAGPNSKRATTPPRPSPREIGKVSAVTRTHVPARMRTCLHTSLSKGALDTGVPGGQANLCAENRGSTQEV